MQQSPVSGGAGEAAAKADRKRTAAGAWVWQEVAVTVYGCGRRLRAFAYEAALIEQAARASRPLHIDFVGDDPAPWTKDPPTQTFTIRYVSNMIEPGKRLLVFQVPLLNQSEPQEKDGRTFLLWRYRPGQRVRLHVPVEQWEKVFVLPAAA